MRSSNDIYFKIFSFGIAYYFIIWDEQNSWQYYFDGKHYLFMELIKLKADIDIILGMQETAAALKLCDS